MQETQEMWVWSLEQEDLLEKEMAPHSSIVVWKIPRTEELDWKIPWPWDCKDKTQLNTLRHIWMPWYLKQENYYPVNNRVINVLLLFSHAGVSKSLRPHGLQHARLPGPSPTSRACSNSCPLSWWCHPITLPSPSPPAFSLSQNQDLSNERVLCIRWPKYWSFSFSIGPSNEYSGLISFRTDWLDLFVVQGIIKGLLQHYRSTPPSILQRSVYSIVQPSHSYMTTGKTRALSRQTFVGSLCLDFQ